MKNYKFRDTEVRLTIGLYTVYDFMGKEIPGLALLMTSLTNGQPENDYDCALSVSFGEHIGIPNAFYVDTNNCPFAEDFLTQNNIATKTNLTKHSGFCEYPLYVLTPEFIQDIKADVSPSSKYYQEYEAAVTNYNPFDFNKDEDDDE